VERAGEGRDACRDGGIKVHLGAADGADGRGRAVLLVVGVEDEQCIEDAHRFGMDLIRLHRRIEHHVEEVRAIRQVMPGVDHRVADRFLVGERRHGANDGDEPRGGDVDIVGHRLEVDVGVERRERVDHRREDVHRVCALGKMVEEMTHILMQHRVDVEKFRKVLAFLFGREFSVNEQVGDFDEHGFFDQLFDGDAAIAQDSLFSVDERDLAVAGRRIEETRVERHVTGLTTQIRDIDPFFSFGADHHGQPHHFVFDLKRHKLGTLVHMGILLLNSQFRCETSRGNAPAPASGFFHYN